MRILNSLQQSLNFVVEWLRVLLRILEVSGSNLGHEIISKGFCNLIRFSRQFLGKYRKLGNDRFLTHLFVIHLSPFRSIVI
jgi:hypothetical protein